MRRTVVGAAFVLFAACATGRVPHVPGDPAPAVPDASAEAKYQQTLERYTAHQGVYDDLDTKVFFYATWQSATFATARVDRQGVFKSYSTTELADAQSAEANRLADATEFFLAVHVNESRFDDFDRPDSMWRLRLLVNGEDLKPLAIERMGRTNVELRSSYSYLESFWVGYRVRFPKVALQRQEVMTLRAASPLGKAELSFTAD